MAFFTGDCNVFSKNYTPILYVFGTIRFMMSCFLILLTIFFCSIVFCKYNVRYQLREQNQSTEQDQSIVQDQSTDQNQSTVHNHSIEVNQSNEQIQFTERIQLTEHNQLTELDQLTEQNKQSEHYIPKQTLKYVNLD